ncbi:hypothetical protein B0J14DRAFT_599714 [Halenospora varia]|nr:hypothetical protein B0J14DRAFT_599714 [Halenospora varia]
MSGNEKMDCAISDTGGERSSNAKDVDDAPSSKAKLESCMVKLSIDPFKLKEITESEPKNGKEKCFKCNSDPCTCGNGEDEEFDSQPQKKVKTIKTEEVIDINATNATNTDINAPNTTNPTTTFTNHTGTHIIPTNHPPSSAPNYISAHTLGATTCLDLMQHNLSTSGTLGNISPTDLNFDIPDGLKGNDRKAYREGYKEGWIAALQKLMDIFEMVSEEKGAKTCRECGVCVVHDGEVGEGKCGGPLAKAGYPQW